VRAAPVAATPDLPRITPLLAVEDLSKTFDITPGLVDRMMHGPRMLHAVDGISFTVNPGETLGLVGESGCGKSTTARLITRLISSTGGRVLLRGQDVLAMPQREFAPLRKSMQIVFQDPFSSLNPRKRVGQIVGRSLAIHMGLRGAALAERTIECLVAVGLSPDHVYRYPHEFSGGQRQRIAIARALAPEPELLIADEPVSALDVSVQAQVLNLLRSLKEQRHFSMIFISHNLSVVEYLADSIAVMYAGKIVEAAPAEQLFAKPLHPYTQALLAARSEPDPHAPVRRVEAKGEPTIPINPKPGCRFASRCPIAIAECSQADPPLEAKEPSHEVACIRA